MMFVHGCRSSGTSGAASWSTRSRSPGRRARHARVQSLGRPRSGRYAVPSCRGHPGLAAHLGHRFTLVAHDWGGAVAWVFAMIQPGMLERLVADQRAASRGVCPRAAREPGAAEGKPVHAAVPQPRGGGRVVRRRLIRRCGSRSATCRTSDFTDERPADVPGGMVAAGRAHRRAELVPAPRASDRRRRMRRRRASSTPAALPVIEVPTLVIWGEQDRALTTGNWTGWTSTFGISPSGACPTARTGWCTSSRN